MLEYYGHAQPCPDLPQLVMRWMVYIIFPIWISQLDLGVFLKLS